MRSPDQDSLERFLYYAEAAIGDLYDQIGHLDSDADVNLMELHVTRVEIARLAMKVVDCSTRLAHVIETNPTNQGAIHVIR